MISGAPSLVVSLSPGDGIDGTVGVEQAAVVGVEVGLKKHKKEEWVVCFSIEMSNFAL